jgi:hypothetical protein
VSHPIEKPTDITVPPTSLWAKLPMIGGAMAVVGLGATFGMAFGEHKARAMFAYLFAYEYGLYIALGALGFVLIQHLVRAGWSTVVRRVAETAMATLPLFLVLWLPIGLLGFHELYPWSHETDEILERKRWFLSNGFFFGRAGLYLIGWSALAVFLYRSSVKIDTMTDLSARDRLIRTMWKVSAGGIFFYGLTQSFQAVDWLMSLQPHWYSTIFGVYYFAGSILALYSFVTLATMALQKAGMLKHSVTAEHFQDLGKFVFGHTIFWAYIAVSQLIIIWYANIPEETEFYMARLEGGWEYISYALPITNFFIPFLYLVSRHVKRHRLGLAIGCIYTLVMRVVDMYWLVLPNYGAHGEGHHEPHLAIHWLDLTALLGVGGAFLAVFGWLMAKNKVIAIGDPRLEESLKHENY